MNWLDRLSHSIRTMWHRTPALQVLVPIALGIHLCTLGYSSGALLLSSCSLACLMLSIVLCRGLARGQAVYLTGQRLFALGIGGALCATMMIRTDRLPSLTPQSAEMEHTRLELVESLKSEPTITPEVQRLLSAISLGYTERDAETRALRQSFVRSGAAHILAVSGYHLALVIGLCALVLGRLGRWGIPRWAHWAMLIVLSWLFVALVGWGVPAQRAALMMTIYFGGKMLHRPTLLPNILSASALIQLLLSPHYLYSYGMWLSYVAVLSISLYGRRIYGLVSTLRQPVLSWLWGALSVTLAAQVLVLPLCLYLFGFVSWSFILTCLPMAVLSAVIIPLGLVAYGLSSFGIALHSFGSLTNALGEWMLSVARYGSKLTFLDQHTALPLWGLILLWTIALLGSCFLPARAERPRVSRA